MPTIHQLRYQVAVHLMNAIDAPDDRTHPIHARARCLDVVDALEEYLLASLKNRSIAPTYSAAADRLGIVAYGPDDPPPPAA